MVRAVGAIVVGGLIALAGCSGPPMAKAGAACGGRGQTAVSADSACRCNGSTWDCVALEDCAPGISPLVPDGDACGVCQCTSGGTFVCDDRPCPQCPAPVDQLSPAGNDPAWARDPLSSACCHYDHGAQAPLDWTLFSTADACGAGRCGCNVIVGQDSPMQILNVEPLECAPIPVTTLDEWTSSLCAHPDQNGSVYRVTGCGVVVVQGDPGFGGSIAAFDPTSGQLVGIRYFNDVNDGVCRAFAYAFGNRNATGPCASTTTCRACGDNPAVAPCQP